MPDFNHHLHDIKSPYNITLFSKLHRRLIWTLCVTTTNCTLNINTSHAHSVGKHISTMEKQTLAIKESFSFMSSLGLHRYALLCGAATESGVCFLNLINLNSNRASCKPQIIIRKVLKWAGTAGGVIWSKGFITSNCSFESRKLSETLCLQKNTEGLISVNSTQLCFSAIT